MLVRRPVREDVNQFYERLQVIFDNCEQLQTVFEHLLTIFEHLRALADDF